MRTQNYSWQWSTEKFAELWSSNIEPGNLKIFGYASPNNGFTLLKFGKDITLHPLKCIKQLEKPG